MYCASAGPSCDNVVVLITDSSEPNTDKGPKGPEVDSELSAACTPLPRFVNPAKTLAPGAGVAAAAAAFVVGGGVSNADTCVALVADVAYPFIAATS